MHPLTLGGLPSTRDRELTQTSTPPRCPIPDTDINLHSLQKTLDKQGLEIVDNQKENMVGRKKLAESTRGEVRVQRLARLS